MADRKSIIKKFSIGEASYFITGEDGETVELNLDYANSSYLVKIKKGYKVSKYLQTELESVANHLLRDKARKNLVKRLRAKKIIS